MNKKYWFKNKEYGLGWVPATREGWMVIAAHAAAAVVLGFYAEQKGYLIHSPEKFFVPMILIIVLLIVISWKTGEPLKWRWGKRK